MITTSVAALAVMAARPRLAGGGTAELGAAVVEAAAAVSAAVGPATLVP